MSPIFVTSQAIKVWSSRWLTALAGCWIFAKLALLQKRNFGGVLGIVQSTLK